MSRRTTNLSRGFTLIEIMISTFIFAMMIGVAVPTVNSLTNVHLKSSAQKLNGNLKYLFDRSILDRIYIRLVIDLDSGTYWSESTKDPFFLQQKPQSVEQGMVIIEDEEDEEEDQLSKNFEESAFFNEGSEEMKWGGWADFSAKFKKKKAVFSTYKTELSTKTELPQEVVFYRIETQAIAEPVTAGKVFIHFFPNGYVEKSAIWLARADEIEDEELLPEDLEVYSIILEPLTGRSVIYDYGVELPEDLEDVEDW